MLGIETKRKRTALPVPLAGREIEGHAMGTHGGCQRSRGDVSSGCSDEGEYSLEKDPLAEHLREKNMFKTQKR